MFTASVIEEVIAPIPSAVVGLAAGFFFVPSENLLDTIFQLILTVIIPLAAGVTVGSLFVYTIAYFAGKPFLQKWGKWFGVSWNDVEKIQQKFLSTKFDEISLVVARSIPIVPSVVVSAFCGLIRFPLRDYFVYTFAGSFVRASILGFAGWQVGEVYIKYAEVINASEKFILMFGAVAVMGFFVWRRRRAKNVKEESTNPL